MPGSAPGGTRTTSSVSPPTSTCSVSPGAADRGTVTSKGSSSSDDDEEAGLPGVPGSVAPARRSRGSVAPSGRAASDTRVVPDASASSLGASVACDSVGAVGPSSSLSGVSAAGSLPRSRSVSVSESMALSLFVCARADSFASALPSWFHPGQSDSRCSGFLSRHVGPSSTRL